MSYLLFSSIHILDDLLNEVQRTGYGARLASMSVGCLAYADDITLISPTAGGIQNMLNVCKLCVLFSCFSG